MHANVIVIEERPNLLSKSLDEDATLDTQQIRNSIEMVPYPRGGIHKPCGHGRGRRGLVKCSYYNISLI